MNSQFNLLRLLARYMLWGFCFALVTAIPRVASAATKVEYMAATEQFLFNNLGYPSALDVCNARASKATADAIGVSGGVSWTCSGVSNRVVAYANGDITYNVSFACSGGGCSTSTSNSTAAGKFVCQYGWTYTGSTNISANCMRTTTVDDTPPPPPPPPCQNTDPFIRKWFMTANTAFPDHFDICVIAIDEVMVCRKEIFSGVTRDVCMLKVHNTGAQWTGQDTTPPLPPINGPDSDNKNLPKSDMPPAKAPPNGPNQGKCPAGSVQGGIDSTGIPICIGTGTTPPPPISSNTKTNPPVTSTNPDGSTTTTVTSERTNADGSITITKTVTNTAADGTKSVSQTGTTGNNAAGAQGKTDDPDADKNNLCKQNPTLSICRESSVTGSCEAITCTGDAIQCATLRAAAAMECRDKQDRDDAKASPLTSLGNAALAGNDPSKSLFPSAANGQVVTAPASLDQTTFISGSSYFADKTFSVQGHTITIPFSKTASIMLAFRYALMLVASLVSFNIIRGAVLS